MVVVAPLVVESEPTTTVGLSANEMLPALVRPPVWSVPEPRIDPAEEFDMVPPPVSKVPPISAISPVLANGCALFSKVPLSSMEPGFVPRP